MLSEAIEYPFEGEDTLETFLLGGALYLLAPLVVPGILLGGYSVAVVRAVMEGRTEPPTFEDWEGYLRDGLAVLAISIVYWLPALVLAGLGLGLFVIAGLVGVNAGSGAAGALLVLLLGAGTVAGFAYTLVVAYLLPAAVVNFARTGTLGAAWDVDTLRSVATDGRFAKAWVVAAAVLLVADTVGGALSVFLVGFVVFFYGQVAATYLYARGAMDALDVSPEPPAPPSAPEEVVPGDSDAGEGGDGGNVGDAGDADDVVDREAGGPDNDTGGETERALTDVAGIGPSTAEALRESGFGTVADLESATRDELTDVDGVGPAKADEIKRDVGDA